MQLTELKSDNEVWPYFSPAKKKFNLPPPPQPAI